MITEHASLVDEAIAEIEQLFSYRRRAFCAHPIHREISLPQLYILMNLQERGSLTVSELTDLLGVTAPSVSAIIDRLEERELVWRERDAEDRRVVHVLLTERGHEMIDEVAGMRRESMQRLLSLMDDEQLGHVIQAVEAIRQAVDRLS